jgi:hypothetical protein
LLLKEAAFQVNVTVWEMWVLIEKKETLKQGGAELCKVILQYPI